MASKKTIRNEFEKIDKHLDVVLVDLYNVLELLKDGQLTQEASYIETLGAYLYAVKESLQEMYHYF